MWKFARDSPSSAAGAVAVSRLVSVVAAAVQLPLLTRMLTPAEYAVLAATMAAATYMSLAIGDPITLAYQRFPGTARERSSFAYARASLFKWLLFGLAAGLVAGLTTGRVSTVVAIVGWAAGLAGMRFVSTAWLMWHQPWMYSINLVSSTVLRTAVLVGCIVIGVPFEFALGFAGASSFAIAVLLGPRVGATIPALKAPWPRRMGVTLALASLGTTVLQNFDKMVLPVIVDARDAGVYAALYQAVAVSLGAVLSILVTVAFPRALSLWNAGRAQDAVFFTQRLMSVTYVGSAVCLIFAASLAERVIGALLGPEYANGSLAVAAVGISSLSAVTQQAAWVHRFTLEVARVRNASLIAAGLAVVGILATAPHFGLKGSLASVSTAAFVGLLLNLQGTAYSAREGVMAVGLYVVAMSGAVSDAQGLQIALAAVFIGATCIAASRTFRR